MRHLVDSNPRSLGEYSVKLLLSAYQNLHKSLFTNFKSHSIELIEASNDVSENIWWRIQHKHISDDQNQ